MTYLRAAVAGATLLAWAAFAVLALHRSGEPDVLGRYSTGYARLLACALAGCIALSLTNHRRLLARIVAWRRELLLRVFDPVGIGYYSEMRRYEQDRVPVLGDSVALGWGVRQEETFSAVLERRLPADLARPVRVINTGVCSYNTVMELAWLREHGFARNLSCPESKRPPGWTATGGLSHAVRVSISAGLRAVRSPPIPC